MDHIIARFLDQRKDFFVFPSEVAGEYRLREAVLGESRKVIRSDRFISWDRLKEREFSPSREKLPSNTLYRTLFSMVLLEEHMEKGPLLRVLLGTPSTPRPENRSGDRHEDRPGGDVSMFRNQLALMLPQLQKAVRLLDEGRGCKRLGGFPVPLEQDLFLLYERYVDFLEKNGLFEPAYIVPSPGSSEFRYHIFYPELIEDYQEYRGLIEKDGGFIVHSPGEFAGDIRAAGISGQRILRFENARQELQYLVSRIHGLLESGVHPGDIAVTLPDYDAWQPFLKEEARVRDIPLDFRAGRKLSEYPAGLLFQRIGELLRNGMALDQLKQLILEPAYPWSGRKDLESLVRFGVDHYFVRNLPGNRPEDDSLSAKLRSAGASGLLSLYRSLKKHLRQMMSADTAATLQQEVHIFLRTFFDPGGWDPEAEKVLQYCLLILREMREAEARLESMSISSPYALWTSLMGRQIYVAGARTGMLPVYRYRVSAGISPRYHFIPGAGQTETRVSREDFSFLREDHRTLLAGELPPDFSRDFLRVYAESGEQVLMSCSDRGFGGPQLPPAELMEAGLVENVDTNEGNLSEPYLEEESFWAFEGNFPERLFSLQKTGFEGMDRTGFSRKKIDHTRSPVTDGILSERLGQVIRGEDGLKDGRVWLSPTAFDRYAGCPYLFFLQSGLGLGREVYDAPYIDHLRIGSMLHRILAEIYRRVQDEDGRWRSEHTDRYLEIAGEAVSLEFETQEARGNAFLQPSWVWFRTAAEVQVGAFIRREGEIFDGYELVGTEQEMKYSLPGGKAGMHGRIDRLTRKDGKAALLDYKKSRLPTRKDVYQLESLPQTSQLPFYAWVAERNGIPVASASYYSLKEQRFSHIYVHPEAPMAGNLRRARISLQPEEFAAQAKRIEEAVGKMAEEMEGGYYQARENCGSCNLRSVCRTKYNLRLPEEKSGG